MSVPNSCPVCGRVLLAGRCLACETRRWSRFVHRELVVLVLLAGVAVIAFLATRSLAAADHRLRRRQAAAWFETGQQRLQAGRVDAALAALRRAVIADRENRRYRLALGDALVARGRDDEARRLLLALRDTQPEDPETNLQLARLEARAGDGDASRRHYQAALAALWPAEQAERRRVVRIELIDELLERHERPRALSELLVLAANLPNTPDIQVEVGRRFLMAEDARRARDHFAAALRTQPANRAAIAGAGEAAFALGDYAGARRYLEAVAGVNARLDDLRETTRLVLDGDPLAPRLTAADRRRRLSAALTQARARLDACLVNLPDDRRVELESLRRDADAAAAALQRNRASRDLVDDGLDLVYRIERGAVDRCRIPASPFDRALVLIGRRHGFEDL
jgi:Tfp pilus assembly protein PilF